MSLPKDLLVIDPHAGQPVYLQISNAFIRHIREGRLRKGLRLPGSRELAALLQVNRMTVVAALQELTAQGWIEMLPRKGAFVKADLPVLQPARIRPVKETVTPSGDAAFTYNKKRIIPVHSSGFPPAGKLVFNDGFPDPRITPVNELVRAMRSLGKRAANKRYLMYGGAQGTLLLRQTLADFLCDTRGLRITPENMLITNGAQMGIYIATSVILQPGDGVIVGVPGYDMAATTFRQLGAVIHQVPVDEEGMNIDAVKKICARKKIRMVYVIPHHHNPTTVTLTPQRRMQLLELAQQHQLAILEDDYDYDFHYASKPVMPMASYDRHGHIIYIGTLTKTLAPAIRVGFMVAPAEFIKVATWLRKTIDTQGDSLMENAIATLYRDGTIPAHIKKSVKLYRERRDHFCALLQKELGSRVAFSIPDGGMSVWTRFIKNDMRLVSKSACEKGLIINDGTHYDTAKTTYNAVRLGFASLNEKEQVKAVGILKECM